MYAQEDSIYRRLCLSNGQHNKNKLAQIALNSLDFEFKVKSIIDKLKEGKIAFFF